MRIAGSDIRRNLILSKPLSEIVTSVELRHTRKLFWAGVRFTVTDVPKFPFTENPVFREESGFREEAGILPSHS